MSSNRPYKIIMNFLMEIIERAEFAPNCKLPSERMLAIKFNASRRSIRLAYDNLIAQGFVSKTHGKGYFTTGNKTANSDESRLAIKKIYFIVPALSTRFIQDILNGITDFCDEHALDISIKISKGDTTKETQYINFAFTSDAKGIILFPLDNETMNNELLKLASSRFPVAIIDRSFKNLSFSFISTDHFNAMLEAVGFLYAKKHKHLLYIAPSLTLASSTEERVNGYRAGIKKYYGEIQPSNLLIIDYFSYDEIYKNTMDYLIRYPETDVLILPGIKIATDAVIAAINTLKLSAPKDIKIMIFDSDFSTTEINLIRPYIIQQDAYQIGYRSASALYNQIYGDLHTESIRLPISIIDHTTEL